MWQYVLNPFGLTPESESKMRLPAAILLGCSGVLLCWFGGFAKLGYQYSFFSNAVFSEAFQVLVKSAGLSLVLSLYLARKNPKLYWEIALGGFWGISICYARWCWHIGVFPSWLKGR